MTAKSIQRNTLLAQRRALSQEQRKKWNEQIAQKTLQWCSDFPNNFPNKHRLTCVGIYNPIQAEPDLHAIYPALIAMNIILALPIAPKKDHPLVFVAWKPGEALMKDRYGVLIPTNTKAIVRPEVLFIPCVGYNQRGFRLGYGGGFYDRTLATHPETLAVGIAFKNCLCDLIESEHDIAMKCIITNDE